MQRSWVLATLVASGLLAQTPPAEPPPAPVQAPLPPAPAAEVKPEAAVQATPVEAKPLPVPVLDAFAQLRPSQRKLAYHLQRAALSAHELGYYRSHPRALEVREALEALLNAKAAIPEKAQAALPAAEAYLVKLRANHGLYDAAGTKVLLEGSWKDLQKAAQGAAKGGTKGLESRLAKLKGLLFDAKVDAVAPTWAAPEAPAKGKKAKALKAPKAPEGFGEQKAILALWVKRTQAWVENTRQETEVKGEKKFRSLPDPVQTQALKDLLTWLDKDDLDLLRDPAFGWLDLGRLGQDGRGLLTQAGAITTSKAPEGAPAEAVLVPTLEPVMAEAKLAKGDEKRTVLAEVKQGPAPATLADQRLAFEKLARSRDYQAK